MKVFTSLNLNQNQQRRKFSSWILFAIFSTALAPCFLAGCALPPDRARANVSDQETANVIVLANSKITVKVMPGKLNLSRPTVIAWVKRAATAVARYYGHFPVDRAVVRITPFSGRGFGFATTDSEDGAGSISIPLGDSTTQEELDDDWVLTHEMVHLAFPLTYPRDRWLVEGMATYIEPLARMQAGYISRERIWKELVNGLPQGLPDEGQHGLDNNQSWGRTYWGGALFCLLADLEIRKATGNKKGLQDALQKIDNTDGNIISDMEVADAIQLGDTAIGPKTHILEDLYNKMRSEPVTPDLDKLWRDLGVKKQGRTVTFDEQAPLAAARRAIDAGR